MSRSLSRRVAAVILPLLVAIFCGLGVHGEELVIVQDGESQAPIVIFQEAPPKTRRAADELAQYIEKVSGARPDVIEGEPDPVPENALWIGHQPVLNDLFPDLDFDFQQPEEILIAANENHLVIAGRDRWNPDHQRVELRRATVDGVQMEYGTVNAVYTFLQDYLDVRWLWPGELGTDVIQRDRIAFAPFEFRYHPHIRGRSGIFTFSSLGNRGYGRSHRWTRRQRLQLSSLQFGGGHGFSDWWARFHETNPEFFALQPDGSRGGGDEPWPSARTVKMCKSNPALWEQWLDDVENALDDNPNRQVFNAAANDGWSSGYCICEKCLAWDHPEAEKRRFSWSGISQDYVAMSDRQVTFANQLARGLRERFPERDDLYVSIMAYGHSIPAPVEAVPDDNVLISTVASFHNRKWTGAIGRTETSAEHLERFKAWGEIAPNLIWRPNLGFGIWEQGLPRVAMDKVIDDFQRAADNNVIGVFFDSVWEHWSGHGPHYYMLAQMAWDPYADGHAILSDYYRRGFGKAADDIEAYWTLMQDITRFIVKNDEGTAVEGGLLAIYDEDFFEEAYGYLDRADKAVEGEPDKYGKRVEFVRIGLDHTRSMMRVRELMRRFRESGGEDGEAEDEARRVWVEEIHPRATDEEFRYAINWGPVRPGHGRSLGGMYPEDLHRKQDFHGF